MARVTLDISPFGQRCARLAAAVEKVNVNPAPLKLLHNQTTEVIRHTCARISSWPAMLQPRPKRQAVLGALLGGTIFGGVIDELWHSATDGTNTVQHLHNLNNRLTSLTHEVESIVEWVTEDMKLGHLLAVMQSVTAATINNARLVDSVSDALIVLVSSGRVTPDLIPLESAGPLWGSIQKELRVQSLPQSPYPPSTIYEFPASFRFENNRIHIGIQVPLITTTFTLFHKNDHPSWIKGHSHPLIIGKAGFIAVSPDARAFVRPRSMLAGCSQIRGEPICPLEVARSDWREDCLAALYKTEWARALEICTIQPFHGRWAAERVAHNVFDLVLAAPLSFRESCPAAMTSRDGRWLPGPHNVTIGPGCQLTTADFSLFAAKRQGFIAAVQPTTMWLEPTTVATALAKRQATIDKFRREKQRALNQVASSGLQLQTPHVAAGAVMTALVAAAVGAIAASLILVKCCKPRPPSVRED